MRKAQTLIEVLVALGLAASIILSLFSMAALSTKTGRYNRQKMEATVYMEDALEVIRNIRDTNLKAPGANFNHNMSGPNEKRIELQSTSNPSGGYKLTGAGSGDYDVVGEGGQYRRYVNVQSLDTIPGGQPEYLDVYVKVTWQDDKYKVEGREILTDWQL